jgi:hypothetical protein
MLKFADSLFLSSSGMSRCCGVIRGSFMSHFSYMVERVSV